VEKPLIYDLDLEDIVGLTRDWGEPRYRAHQIWEGVYKTFWQDPSEFTNLPRTLHSALAARLTFRSLVLSV